MLFLASFQLQPEQGKATESHTVKVYSLDERFKYLPEKHPELIVFDPVFGETLCEVPTEKISRLYQPSRKLTQLRRSKQLNVLEAKAVKLATKLEDKAGIPWNAIGVSGSIMAGLTTKLSAMSGRHLRLAVSLCDRIARSDDGPGADVAVSIVMALVVLS